MASSSSQENGGKKTRDGGVKYLRLFGDNIIPISSDDDDDDDDQTPVPISSDDDDDDQTPAMLFGVNILDPHSSTASANHHPQEIPQQQQHDFVDKKRKAPSRIPPRPKQETIFSGKKNARRSKGSSVNLGKVSTPSEITAQEQGFLDKDRSHQKKRRRTCREDDDAAKKVQDCINGGGVQEIGVLDPTYPSLFAKKLEREDVVEGRLHVKNAGFWNNLIRFALTEEERKKLIDEHGIIRVFGWDSRCLKYQLYLAGSAAAEAFVLAHQWRTFVSWNQLKEGDTVEGWGYRVGNHLHFILAYSREKQEFKLEKLLQLLLDPSNGLPQNFPQL